MKKQKLIEVFEEVLENWEMSMGCVIQESRDDDYSYEELEKDVEEYRRKFLEALDADE
ncbi:hypothetical protein [Bacillus luti]|uniref:hypothetical protein n=1 Tax=Bacillus luti TaxID=2026191 RepID=UPI003774E4A0